MEYLENDKPRSRYSADYSRPAPPYEAVDGTQTTSFASRGHSYMDQSFPYNEIPFQVNDLDARYEIDEKQLGSISSYPDRPYNISSIPYCANRSNSTSAFPSAFVDSFHSGNATRAYENGNTKTFSSIATAPSIIQNPIHNDRYNQSTAYSLKEESSDYLDRVSTTFLGSTVSQEGSQRGDPSQQTLSAPRIPHHFPLNLLNYTPPGFQNDGNNSNLDVYYAYQTSAPRVSAFHHPYPSFESLATAPNGISMQHGNAIDTPQSNELLTSKPLGTRYKPLGSLFTEETITLPYGQLENRNHSMLDGGALPNNDAITSQTHHPYTSCDTLQASVILQRRASVPTNSFASMDLGFTEPIYDFGASTYTYSTGRNQIPTHANRHHSQSVSMDDISPKGYPSKCPHPECVSKPNKRRSLTFTTYKDWRCHFNRTHVKPHRCGIKDCEMAFCTNADVKRHRLARHIDKEEPRQFPCMVPNCQAQQKEFTRSDKFKEHRDKWHGTFCCMVENCMRGLGHGFSNQAGLEKHHQRKHMQG
ncbi:hypothetical protein DSL72_004920 [Monilinia vaccinii-corymbosi]|uniref:C2H2-type domain-containing protein n=1 Tax=Monilinia vaccinii-corymbosi TaxID=61207 RepID=A0A8A3PA34_9HELO|nr:hypothetical protein DSL72_004920 [Monilinia vaccinii-corymbosi]